MTEFEVIKGGASIAGNNSKQKIEKLNMLVSHMRSIDSNMSAIHQQGLSIGWKELSDKTLEIKEKILDLLRLIKNKEKKFKGITSKKTDIKIVSSTKKE